MAPRRTLALSALTLIAERADWSRHRALRSTSAHALLSTLLCVTLAAAASAQNDVGSGAQELVQLRSRAAKHYRTDSGRQIAVIASAPVHYESPDGAWADLDNNFEHKSSGEDVAVGGALVTRSDDTGITVQDRHGAGVTWLLPERASLADSKTASVEAAGATWTYELTREGVKAAAAIAAPRGLRTYRFPFQVHGEGLSFAIDADGNADLGDVLRVPPPIVLGADGKTYLAGQWSLVTAADSKQEALEFTFDDGTLPAQAYPYTLDPTTTLPSETIDGEIYGSATS